MKILAAALLLVLAARPLAVQANDFSYYKLAVTNADVFCAAEDSHKSRFAQCRNRGVSRFSVHGFWPQNDRGWPQYCPSHFSYVPTRIVRQFRDVVPDKRAVQYQWRKHGACSGLEPLEYFTNMRTAMQSIDFQELDKALEQNPMLKPAQAKQVLLKSNPDLAESGISFHCKHGALQDIRFCLSKSLQPQACPADTEDGSCGR